MDGQCRTAVPTPELSIAQFVGLQCDTNGAVVAEHVFDADALRRIQACVAACEGISTQELEAGIIQQMQRTLVQVVPLLQEAQSIKARCA